MQALSLLAHLSGAYPFGHGFDALARAWSEKSLQLEDGNETGERVSNDEMLAIRIKPRSVCPAWSYTILPRLKPSPNDWFVHC